MADAYLPPIGSLDPLLLLCAIASTAALAVGIMLLRRAGSDSGAAVDRKLDALAADATRTELAMREELSRCRREAAEDARRIREETAQAIARFSDSVVERLGSDASKQTRQLDGFAKQLARLTRANDQRMEQVRRAVDGRLAALQKDNAKRLDEMRRTVDEKLQSTLEKRLGESFKMVSDRLEQVHQGLGEMQALATGVGDLKRVLTNVKTRGTWGEIQLESILEQILSPEQYDKNVATKPNSAERVEFCINLPGRGGDVDSVWLPIDAKFPQEDYQRLLDAQEAGDMAAAATATKALETRFRACAKDIRDKYLEPPSTTDFAILFVPTEGLYAECVRNAELLDDLQRTFRVVVAGPTTLAALLNSLQMGFRTLAIEKRTSEVWKTLSGVKTEFGKFGDILDGVQAKLAQASGVIDKAASKTRTIERKLRDVEALPGPPSEDSSGESAG